MKSTAQPRARTLTLNPDLPAKDAFRAALAEARHGDRVLLSASRVAGWASHPDGIVSASGDALYLNGTERLTALGETDLGWDADEHSGTIVVYGKGYVRLHDGTRIYRGDYAAVRPCASGAIVCKAITLRGKPARKDASASDETTAQRELLHMLIMCTRRIEAPLRGSVQPESWTVANDTVVARVGREFYALSESGRTQLCELGANVDDWLYDGVSVYARSGGVLYRDGMRHCALKGNRWSTFRGEAVIERAHANGKRLLFLRGAEPLPTGIITRWSPHLHGIAAEDENGTVALTVLRRQS